MSFSPTSMRCSAPEGGRKRIDVMLMRGSSTGPTTLAQAPSKANTAKTSHLRPVTAIGEASAIIHGCRECRWAVHGRQRR
jgi:hypothetical protein